MKLIVRFLFLAILALYTAQAAAQSKPVIYYFDKYTASSGDTITVYGNGFKQNTTECELYFGSLKLNVLFATDSILKFTAPIIGGSEKLIYSDFTNTAYSNQRLTITFNGDSRIDESSFLSSSAEAIVSTKPSYIDKCDFDHDGRLDLVIASESEKKLTVLKNNTPIPYAGDQVTINSFTLGTKLTTDSFTLGVFTCDLNNDGWNEIITTSEQVGRLLIYENLQVSNSINQTSFAAPVSLNLPAKTSTEVAFADFNLDGKIDIAVTSADSSKVYILKNNSTQHKIENTSFELVQTIEVGNCNDIGVLGIKCVDLNNDNNIDIVTTLQCSNQLVIIPNNGAFSFGMPIKIKMEAQPICVETADLNNDNKQDILVSIKDYGLAVLTNQGNSNTIDSLSFIKQNISLKSTVNKSLTWQINACDFNGDGKMDVSLNSLFSLTLFKNTATQGEVLDSNNLQQATSFVIPNFTYSHAIGDFNLDGRSDIILTTINPFGTNGTIKFLTNSIGYPVGLNNIGNNLINPTQLYPNPANGSTTIQSIYKIQQVNLMNNLGQLKQTIRTNYATEYSLNIDLFLLNDGLYSVEIIHQNGIKSIQKLCIQK